MVNYNCPRCGYETNRKSNIARHIDRENPCKPILKDIKVSRFRSKILKGDKKLKIKNEETEIERLRRENKELKERQVGNTTIINNDNSTTNVINITLPYRQTNHDFLSDKDYIRCINRMIMSVPNLIKRIHFNPEHPENHNIYINDMNRNRIMVYDGTQWNVQNQKDTIDRLINDHDYILDEWVECGEEKYPNAMEKFKKYVQLRSQNDVEEKIKDEVRYILYNNRGMIDKDKKSNQIKDSEITI